MLRIVPSTCMCSVNVGCSNYYCWTFLTVHMSYFDKNEAVSKIMWKKLGFLAIFLILVLKNYDFKRFFFAF